MAENAQNLTPHDSRHGGCDYLRILHHARTLRFPANHPAYCHRSAPVHTGRSDAEVWRKFSTLRPFAMNDGNNDNSCKRTHQRSTANNGSWYRRKYQKYRYTKTVASKNFDSRKVMKRVLTVFGEHQMRRVCAEFTHCERFWDELRQ